MKKTLALFLALMLTLSLQPACASGLIFTPTEAAPAPAADAALETETITLDCGLSFPAPVEWSDGPLPESFRVENELYARYDGEGRFMQLRTNDYNKNLSVEDMEQLFATSDSFTNVKVSENPLGQKVLYSEAITGNFLSLMVFDGEGTAYILTFGNFHKGHPVVEDAVFMGLVDTVMQNILFTSAAPAAEPSAAKEDDMLLHEGVEYEAINDGGLRFLIPAHWTVQPLTEEMEADHVFMLLMDEENGYVMEGRIEYPEDGATLKDCSEAMRADTDTYGDLITGNNEMGHPVIIFKHKDNLASGYAAMNPEGDLFVFTFHTTDNSLVPTRNDLTTIIAHCATHVCAADKAEPAPQPAGEDFEFHTINNAFTIPCPGGWTIGGEGENQLFRATDPESGVYFYVRMNTYDRPRDPQQVYEAFAAGDKIGYAELVTGKDGLQIIRADAEDGTFSALMIPDDVGNVYIITLTGKGNMQVLDNDAMLGVRDLLISEMTLK